MKIQRLTKYDSGRRVVRFATDEFPADGRVLKNGVSHVGVNRCLRFLTKHFSRPIRLEDLVKTAGMSRRGFIKAFNRHIGLTPAAVLRQMRIEYAKQLLVEEDLPLKVIASRTGFRSENTFCVAFSRAMGMPPKKYQRQVWLADRRANPN